ncbi:TetR/AcrR family transcriptional regulator [Variovorax sp. CCNWLW235]
MLIFLINLVQSNKIKSSNSSEAGEKQGYHHGNLREALIQGGLKILREEGIEGVTLRAVAQYAGVSQAAIRNHYRDKNSLLAAMAAAGHVDLSKRRGRKRGQPTKLEDVIGLIFSNYVEFAIENPDLFRLMFAYKSLRRQEYSDLESNSTAALRNLMDLLSQALALEGIFEKDVEPLTFKVWSAMHGIAMLAIDGQYVKIAGNRTLIAQHCRELAQMIAVGFVQVENLKKSS